MNLLRRAGDSAAREGQQVRISVFAQETQQVVEGLFAIAQANVKVDQVAAAQDPHPPNQAG